MRRSLARYRFLLLAAGAALLIGAALWLTAHPNHKVDADTLAGKWVGTVIWNDASGRPYEQKMQMALFFLPKGVTGTILSFPTGAFGGVGHFTLHGSRLSVQCRSLSINGRPLPLSTFSGMPWYRGTAVYDAACDGATLTLTPVPAAGPTPAPSWPLFVSPKPIVLSRVAPPPDAAPVPAPRE